MQTQVNPDSKVCFFCEESDDSSGVNPWIEKINNIWVHTQDYDSIMPFNKQCHLFGHACKEMSDERECPICYNNTELITLLNCPHQICIHCCKTIYFGSSNEPRPTFECELKCPKTDNITDEQFDFYTRYEWHERANELNDNGDRTIIDLLSIRNSLMTERPDWMNTNEFIEFENEWIAHLRECGIAETAETNYRNTMITTSNRCCPLCRK
jgi:hypothetical protein